MNVLKRSQKTLMKDRSSISTLFSSLLLYSCTTVIITGVLLIITFDEFDFVDNGLVI
jgi:hypothetical protein